MANPRPKIHSFLDDIPESEGFLETPKFLNYTAKVQRVLMKFKKHGACTNDIHKKLGRDLQYMTLSALSRVSTKKQVGSVTRYFPTEV